MNSKIAYDSDTLYAQLLPAIQDTKIHYVQDKILKHPNKSIGVLLTDLCEHNMSLAIRDSPHNQIGGYDTLYSRRAVTSETKVKGPILNVDKKWTFQMAGEHFYPSYFIEAEAL